MLVRTLAVLLIVAVTGNTLLAAENTTAINVGDYVVIRMTGDLAKEYARLTHWPKADVARQGIEISTMATIVRKDADGRCQIEHSSQINTDGNPTHLVTLLTVVDAKQIASDITPKNTPIYGSPADHQNGVKPTFTKQEQRTLRLDLSDIKGLKLRVWTLAKEIGN